MKHNSGQLSVAWRWLLVVVGLSAGFALGFFTYSVPSTSGSVKSSEPDRPRVSMNTLITNADSEIADLEPLDNEIERYLRRWEINGAAIAITRRDSLVYAKGYGWADVENHEPMQPGHLLRVASVSKLLTAIGIMRLKDMGKLRLTDRVFGPDGILNDTAFTASIRDKRHFDITVEQLLRHEGGFNNRAGDPMFSTRYIIMQNHLTAPPDNHTLTQIVLRRRLGFTPGSGHYYSNFGYMLLSLIIEKASGMTYEEFMRQEVFDRAGCYDLHIAGNYLADRRKGEVHYYMHSDAEPTYEFNNSGQMVEKCYGENNIPMLLGAGGWMASVIELSRIVASVDLRDELPDILSRESVEQMTREMPNSRFSLGWIFTPNGGRWVRTGTLSGTSALVVKYPDDEMWVMLTNTSTWRGQGFAKESIGVFERLRNKYRDRFPHRNLWNKAAEP